MEEKWAVIPGYEGKYEVSNLGRVKRKIRSKKGYREIINYGTRHHSKHLLVTLYKGGTKQTIFVHRLVALAFIPNPNNLPMINHIDEDGTNNRADNLEWCDAKYNTNYGTGIKRRSEKLKRAVCCYLPDGSFVKTYESMKDAVTEEGLDISALCGCCAGKFASCSGKIWIFRGDEHNLNERIRQYNNTQHPIRVKIVTEQGDTLGEYCSYREAERTTGVSRSAIKKYLNGGMFYSKKLQTKIQCTIIR